MSPHLQDTINIRPQNRVQETTTQSHQGVVEPPKSLLRLLVNPLLNPVLSLRDGLFHPRLYVVYQGGHLGL